MSAFNSVRSNTVCLCSPNATALLTYSATKVPQIGLRWVSAQAEVAVLKTELVRSATEQQKAAGIAARIPAAGKTNDVESTSSDGAKSELASS